LQFTTSRRQAKAGGIGLADKKSAPEGALQIRSRFRSFGRANDIL
jgi:hypothetical protein